MRNKSYELGVVLVAMLFFGNVASAFSQAQITHYDAVGKLDSKRPDFAKANAVIAIDFGGPIAEQAIRMFRGLGVQNFSLQTEGSYPCLPTEEVPALICIHVDPGPAVAVSEWGYSSGSGRNGGAYEQSSFNGSLYDIYLTATLVRYTANGKLASLDLGSASTLAPAGSSYESIGGYGKNGSGGISSMYATSGLNATIGNAVSKDLASLFEPKGFMGTTKNVLAIAQGARPHWVPGADQEVALAFAPSPASQQ